VKDARCIHSDSISSLEDALEGWRREVASLRSDESGPHEEVALHPLVRLGCQSNFFHLDSWFCNGCGAGWRFLGREPPS